MPCQVEISNGRIEGGVVLMQVRKIKHVEIRSQCLLIILLTVKS